MIYIIWFSQEVNENYCIMFIQSIYIQMEEYYSSLDFLVLNNHKLFVFGFAKYYIFK